MFAQILRTSHRQAALENVEGSHRGIDSAARLVQITLAVLLLPALATMLVVGGVGVAAVGAATAFARAAGWEESSSRC